LVASTTSIALVSYLIYGHTAYRVCPTLRLRPRSGFRRHRVRELASFGLYVFLINIAVHIGFNLDHLVIGAWLGTTAVAVYAVSFRLADYQRQLCNQFNGLLFPVLVRFGAAGNTESLRETVTESTRLAFALVAGVTATLLLVGDSLITAWVGPGFEEGVWPLYILALTGVVLVSQQPLGSLLMGTGHHRLVAAACLVESGLNLALSILLVQRFGLLGVAVGTMLPVVCVDQRQSGRGVAPGRVARTGLHRDVSGVFAATFVAAVLSCHSVAPHARWRTSARRLTAGMMLTAGIMRMPSLVAA
jgi:O-antigen/teichoic acid export membrane protein